MDGVELRGFHKDTATHGNASGRVDNVETCGVRGYDNNGFVKGADIEKASL